MGEANGNYRHGMCTNEVIERRRQFQALMRAARETIGMVEETR